MMPDTKPDVDAPKATTKPDADIPAVPKPDADVPKAATKPDVDAPKAAAKPDADVPKAATKSDAAANKPDGTKSQNDKGDIDVKGRDIDQLPDHNPSLLSKAELDEVYKNKDYFTSKYDNLDAETSVHDIKINH